MYNIKEAKLERYFSQICIKCNRRQELNISKDEFSSEENSFTAKAIKGEWVFCNCHMINKISIPISQATLTSINSFVKILSSSDYYLQSFRNEDDDYYASAHIAAESGDPDLKDRYSEDINRMEQNLMDEMALASMGFSGDDSDYHVHVLNLINIERKYFDIKQSYSQNKYYSDLYSKNIKKIEYDKNNLRKILHTFLCNDYDLYLSIIKKEISIEEACKLFPKSYYSRRADIAFGDGNNKLNEEVRSEDALWGKMCAEINNTCSKCNFLINTFFLDEMKEYIAEQKNKKLNCLCGHNISEEYNIIDQFINNEVKIINENLDKEKIFIAENEIMNSNKEDDSINPPATTPFSDDDIPF